MMGVSCSSDWLDELPSLSDGSMASGPRSFREFKLKPMSTAKPIVPEEKDCCDCGGPEGHVPGGILCRRPV